MSVFTIRYLVCATSQKIQQLVKAKNWSMGPSNSVASPTVSCLPSTPLWGGLSRLNKFPPVCRHIGKEKMRLPCRTTRGAELACLATSCKTNYPRLRACIMDSLQEVATRCLPTRMSAPLDTSIVEKSKHQLTSGTTKQNEIFLWQYLLFLLGSRVRTGAKWLHKQLHIQLYPKADDTALSTWSWHPSQKRSCWQSSIILELFTFHALWHTCTAFKFPRHWNAYHITSPSCSHHNFRTDKWKTFFEQLSHLDCCTLVYLFYLCLVARTRCLVARWSLGGEFIGDSLVARWPVTPRNKCFEVVRFSCITCIW